MTYRDCRAFRHEHKGGRFADDLRMPDHDDLESVQIQPRLLDEFHGGCSCAWCERKIVVDDVSDRCGIHSFQVLEGMDGGRKRAHIDVARHRPLEDYAKHIGIVVHCDKACLTFLLPEGAWPHLLIELDADLPCRVGLAANVNRSRLVLSDTHRNYPANGPL